jgi:hypothetical protein
VMQDETAPSPTKNHFQLQTSYFLSWVSYIYPL